MYDMNFQSLLERLRSCWNGRIGGGVVRGHISILYANTPVIRLVAPTDYDIRDAPKDGSRKDTVTIATSLRRDRAHINTRLLVLKNHERVDRVGPAERSGL